MLMTEPIYPKAFSEHFGDDFRRDEINKFQKENSKVVDILAEIATKKAELVDKTPFDNFEDNIAVQIFQERMDELCSLISQHSELTREYVELAIEPVEIGVQELNDKFDSVYFKPKKNRRVEPLRDPVRQDLFPLFFTNAGNCFKRQKELKWAQLRFAYTILYHVGLRVNEMRFFTQEDIQKAIKSAQFSVIHYKTTSYSCFIKERCSRFKETKT